MQYFVDSAHSVVIFVKKYFQSTYFVIFREIALKGSVLYIFIWEFDQQHSKNNANKGRRWRGQR